jgi:PII-like signaling protein
MRMPQEGRLLRVFVGESDKWHGQPVYEAIVLKARELHLASATVLRGPMGFGKNSRPHTVRVLRLSEVLPMIVEIVDSKEKIDTLLPHLDAMVTEGLMTLEKVQVIQYRANGPSWARQKTVNARSPRDRPRWSKS